MEEETPISRSSGKIIRPTSWFGQIIVVQTCALACEAQTRALDGHMADTIKAESIAGAIAKHIERLILQGALLPGEKLASERDLAEKLQVSRRSLRDAIGSLVERGLLVTNRSGTFVAQFLKPIAQPLASLLENNPESVSDYFEFRRIIDEQSARYAALRASEVDRSAIRCCIERMKAAHELENSEEEAQADVDLHLLIYNASHNVVLAHVMREFAEMLRGNIFYSRKRLYAWPDARNKLLAQHIAIAEAVLARKADVAAKAAASHVEFTGKAVEDMELEKVRLASSLLRIERADYIDDHKKRRLGS
jgi:GntR family transcriptional repressor for pyruvate dehydrogenase complex